MNETVLPSAEDLIGQSVAGRFDVVRLLGQGGMGAVYEAIQQPLGRHVALKVIKRSLTDDAVAVRRFTTEAQAVAQLSHPHIVTVHDFGQSEDGKLFIAMELLDGESLRERLAKGGALPWQRTLPIISEVCEALVAAHERSIIHRDLKPDNVMLVRMKGRDDYVKVVDFGVAKLLEVDGSASKITSTGMAVGTPGYISPEQIDGVTDDPRSDLYGLGVMWFEMLTGQSPFSGATPVKLVLEHMTKPAPRPSEVAPDRGIPPEVDRLVQRLMGKSPDGRATGAAALVVELEGMWATAETLPPTAATAALESGELERVRAVAERAPSTGSRRPASQPIVVASAATPAGVVAPQVTPATGAMPTGVAASAPVAPVPPKPKSSVLRWAGIGCLVFFVAPLTLCSVASVVYGGGRDGSNLKISTGDGPASGFTIDVADFTSGGRGETVTRQDGKVTVKLPKLADPDADKLLVALVDALVNRDEVTLKSLAKTIGEEPTPEQEEALEVAEQVHAQLQQADAGVGDVDLDDFGDENTDGNEAAVVVESKPSGETSIVVKTGTTKKKVREKAAAKRREKLAEKLAEEEAERTEPSPAKDTKAPPAKATKPSRNKHPLDEAARDLGKLFRRKHRTSSSSSAE